MNFKWLSSAVFKNFADTIDSKQPLILVQARMTNMLKMSERLSAVKGNTATKQTMNESVYTLHEYIIIWSNRLQR